MATIVRNLTSGGATGIASLTTPSVQAVPNRILFLSVASWVSGSSVPNVPTPTMSGWTFSEVTTVNPFGGSGGAQQRLTLFVGIGTGTGSINISFSGQQQLVAQYVVDQASYTTITGTGGANAIVQNATYAAQAEGFTITLSAFANSNDATYACTAKDAINVIVPTTGMTLLSQVTGSSPNWSIGTLWQNSPNTNPAATFTGSGGDNVAAIAVEISFLSQAGFLGKYH